MTGIQGSVRTIKGRPSIMQHWLVGSACHRNVITAREYIKYITKLKVIGNERIDKRRVAGGIRGNHQQS